MMVEEVLMPDGTKMTVVTHPKVSFNLYNPEMMSVSVMFAYPSGNTSQDFRLSRIQLWDGAWKCISRFKPGTVNAVRQWMAINNTATLEEQESINYRQWVHEQSNEPVYPGYVYLFAPVGLEEQEQNFSYLVKEIMASLALPR